MILYLIGLFCTLWCVYDLFTTKTIDVLWKIVIAAALLCCSWVGLAVYYFILRKRLN